MFPFQQFPPAMQLPQAIVHTILENPSVLYNWFLGNLEACHGREKTSENQTPPPWMCRSLLNRYSACHSKSAVQQYSKIKMHPFGCSFTYPLLLLFSNAGQHNLAMYPPLPSFSFESLICSLICPYWVRFPPLCLHWHVGLSLQFIHPLYFPLCVCVMLIGPLKFCD